MGHQDRSLNFFFWNYYELHNSDYDVEPLPPGSTDPTREAVDLSDLLKVLASRIEDFKDLLVVPRSVVSIWLSTQKALLAMVKM